MLSAYVPVTTLTTRFGHIKQLARALPHTSPWDVTGEQLITWTATQDWARETRRGVRNSLLAFYRWAVNTGRTTGSPAEALPKIRGSQPRPRPTPDAVYIRALTQADRRERLILMLAAEMGLRRGEVAHVHSRDVMHTAEGLRLDVHGKGDRDRLVPVPGCLEAELTGLKGWAFPGRCQGHLSPRWVGKLATRLLPDHWTIHTLRHMFATRAYAVDADVFSVQELLGHASPATTRVYVQVPDDRLRRTVNGMRRVA
jgi:integrase